MTTGFSYNDGGRELAGYKGNVGDCVCRAICIVTGKPYQEVYDFLAASNAAQRRGKYEAKSKAGVKTAAKGINTKRKWFADYMAALGLVWTPTMLVGQGCKVHLTADELPKGRLIVNVSRHFTAVIDGVINDTHNPQRGKPATPITVNGSVMMTVPATPERCVYGYYTYEI
jgi:hypothetical protein